MFLGFSFQYSWLFILSLILDPLKKCSFIDEDVLADLFNNTEFIKAICEMIEDQIAQTIDAWPFVMFFPVWDRDVAGSKYRIIAVVHKVFLCVDEHLAKLLSVIRGNALLSKQHFATFGVAINVFLLYQANSNLFFRFSQSQSETKTYHFFVKVIVS